MRNSEKVTSLIIKGASDSSIRKAAQEEGFITMFEDGINKALEGKTTLEEVLRAVKLEKTI